MELIDTITVRHLGIERQVMLFAGDLALLPESEAVDVLVVSAFPDDYIPTRTSLIGALARAGVSVAELAANKEVDLRQFSSCWLSHPIEQPGVNFRRILCFEPLYRGQAQEVVGDIFRSIVPFTAGTPSVSNVAMPIVAAGHQGESPTVMLEVLADAAAHWLSIGLPLNRIKIILRDSADLQSLRETFARVKQRYSESAPAPGKQSLQHDVFVSYSHKDKDVVDDLVGALRAIRPSHRFFVDRFELRPGVAWQQHIFGVLEKARKVICAFSPDYLNSKVCKDEYHVAWIRHRNSSEGLLLPVYLYTAELPIHMQLIQYEDVREGDRNKISKSAEILARQL